MELYEAKFTYILNDGNKPKKQTEVWMVTAINNGEAEQYVIGKNIDNHSIQELKVNSVRASGVMEIINPKGKDDNDYDADDKFAWYSVIVVLDDLETGKKSKIKNFVRATSTNEAADMVADVYRNNDYEVVEVKKTFISKIVLN